jgi:galactose mutarotase-like enzyme
VVGAGVDGSGASVTLETVVDDSEDAGFGHSTVRRTFRLKDGQLTRDMEATNTGKEAQPLMDGWHPNVDSTPGTISDPENWTIEAPVASYYQTDRELIPLRQDPAPVEGHYDLTTPKRLNGISGEGFDTVFVLKPDVPGGKSATAILRNKKTGLVVKLHINVEENPYFVFWTGQKKDGMPMVGFEAQMYPTDALNMAAAGFGEVRMVKPGESIRSRLVLEAQTGKPAGGAVDRTEVDVIPRAEQGVLSREIGADEALHAGLNRIWENLDRIQARRLVLGRERFFFPASKMTFEQYVRMMKDSGPLSSVNRLNALAQMEAYETALRQELEALDQAQNLDEFGLHAENAALAMGLLRNSCPALAAVQRRHVEGSIGRAKRRLAGLRGSFDWKAFDAQVNLGEACADRGTQMDPRTPAQLVDARGPAAGLVDFWEQVAQQHQMLQADGKKKPTYIWTDQENAGAVISALGELNKTAHSAQIARLLEGYVEGTVIVVSVSDMREKTERIMAGNTIVVSEFLQAYNPGLKGRKPQITAADFSLLDMTGVSVWCLAILKGMPPLRMEAEEIELMGRGREALKRFA